MTKESKMSQENQAPPQPADIRQIAGTPIFSADNERLGALERVIAPSDTDGERYLVINPGIMRNRLGVDQLYVPASAIGASEEDRLVLIAPLESLPLQQWSNMPDEVHS
jgi:hypothetical protein